MLPRDFEFSSSDLDRDPESPNYNRPLMYRFKPGAYNGKMLAGLDIHPSRLIVFIGDEIADTELYMTAGAFQWGESVLQGRQSVIKNADEVAANIVSLIYEAKIDVINVPNLMSNLSDPAYEERLLKRFHLAAAAKGINGTLLLDTEEEYSQKSASFSTLDSLLDKFTQLVSGAADIAFARIAADNVQKTVEDEAKRHTKAFIASVKKAIGIDLGAVVREASGNCRLAIPVTFHSKAASRLMARPMTPFNATSA